MTWGSVTWGSVKDGKLDVVNCALIASRSDLFVLHHTRGGEVAIGVASAWRRAQLTTLEVVS